MPLSLRLLPSDCDRRDPSLAPALGLSQPIFPRNSAEESPENTPQRVTEPEIVLGSELARYLGLRSGHTADLIVVAAGAEEGVEARTLRVRISRTFRSGYYDFDFGLAFAPLSLVPLVFGEAASVPFVYGVKLVDRYADGAFTEHLASAYGLGSDRVQGWREYNRAFFGALRTEKTVMMLLIGLIFLVVGVNIFHSMRRAVAERMEDIAVLRAMGSSPDALRRAFILDGLAIGAGGALAGLVLGLLVAVNVNEVFALVEASVNGVAALVSRIAGTQVGDGTFRVFSPQYFYLMEVPVHVLFPETLFVVAIAAASAAAAAGAAAGRVSRMRPAEVLRYE
jgi:lipoprotein-releasing system permease protein